jgi:hypothetical protein
MVGDSLESCWSRWKFLGLFWGHTVLQVFVIIFCILEHYSLWILKAKSKKELAKWCLTHVRGSGIKRVKSLPRVSYYWCSFNLCIPLSKNEKLESVTSSVSSPTYYVLTRGPATSWIVMDLCRVLCYQCVCCCRFYVSLTSSDCFTRVFVRACWQDTLLCSAVLLSVYLYFCFLLDV